MSKFLNNMVSDKVQHKPASTVKNEGQKLKISDLRRRGIVLSFKQKQRRKSAVQLLHSLSASLFSLTQKSGLVAAYIMPF